MSTIRDSEGRYKEALDGVMVEIQVRYERWADAGTHTMGAGMAAAIEMARKLAPVYEVRVDNRGLYVKLPLPIEDLRKENIDALRGKLSSAVQAGIEKVRG